MTSSAALADRWAWEIAIHVPIARGVSRELFAASVVCQVFPPAQASADLVTLCPEDGG